MRESLLSFLINLFLPVPEGSRFEVVVPYSWAYDSFGLGLSITVAASDGLFWGGTNRLWNESLCDLWGGIVRQSARGADCDGEGANVSFYSRR